MSQSPTPDLTSDLTPNPASTPALATRQFLDFFRYETTTRGPASRNPADGQATFFEDCVLLRPIGALPTGTRVEGINISINFMVWQDGDLTEDVHIMP